MVKKIFSSTRASGLPLALLSLLLLSPLRAQEKDFTSWADVGVEYSLKRAWTLSGGVEWRTKENLGRTDRWGVKLGAGYKPLPFLKLGAGYEAHCRNRGGGTWKLRHRYYADGTLSARVQGVKLSLRERFQHTFDGQTDEFRLRSRLKLACPLPRCKVEPYASVEMYNGLNRGERFDVERMRYRGGIVLPLSKRWEADLFYCRQWEAEKRKDIAGVECTFCF